jgi:ferredoxin-NADP reductase
VLVRLPTLVTPPRPSSHRLPRFGLLDALATPHGAHRYLDLLHPGSSLGQPRAEIVAASHQGIGSVTLALRPDGDWRRFRAGQHVGLTVEIDGVRETRFYSPACAERVDDEIEITVRAHAVGKVSRYLNERARPGMVVGCSAAQGEFVLPRKRPERLLLISGGSGITPVMSMLRTLRDEGHSGEVIFLHYARTRRHIPYREELERIASAAPNIRVALVSTRAGSALAADAVKGHITRHRLRRIAPCYDGAHTYVCGPPSLIAAVRALRAEDDIDGPMWVESFQPPAFAPAQNGAQGSVRFARSGKRAASDGRCLLEQAEQAGLRPSYGCRMGICRMCTTRKTAGSVRNLLNGEVSGGAGEDIQICVTAPVGEVELAL